MKPLLPTVRLPDWLPVVGGRPTGPAALSLKQVARRACAAMEGVLEISETYVLQSIRTHDRIREKTHKALAPGILGPKTEAKKFSSVFSGIKQLRRFFSSLDQDKYKIRKKLLAKIEIIADQRDKVRRALESERRYCDDLQRQQARFDRAPQDFRVEVKTKALSARANFSKERIRMLREFYEAFTQVQPTLDRSLERIDRFVFLVSENARVYDEAYQTLLMKKDMQTALAAMDTSSDLHAVSTEIARLTSDIRQVESYLAGQARRLEK